MTQKRIIVILVVALLLVTVCFSACITREDVEVYLDWGTYRQTVKVKYGATVNAKTVPYLDFDFVEGLYDDADYTIGYNNNSITQSRVVFVKTNTMYPLEKSYFKQTDQKFEESKILLLMNKGFKFDSKLQNTVEKHGVKIAIVNQSNYDNYEQIGRYDFRRVVHLTLSTNGDEELIKAIKTIEQFPQIYCADLNYIEELALNPDDDYYVNGDLWGLNGTYGINAPPVWNTTQGSKKIRVGVIDSGVASHSDLNANVSVGRNICDNSTNTDDTKSHGTHVAGIIGAVGNNGEGVVGVNWNVAIVPIKVMNEDNEIYTSTVVDAIRWASDKWGTNEQIDIINYSIGGFGVRTQVLNEVEKYPGLFVWGGAGNDLWNVDSYSESASFNLPNLISVGAIKRDGARWEKSNYGKKLSTCLPLVQKSIARF